MSRKKRLADDVKPVTVYLTPEEQLVISAIEKRRQKRGEVRDSPSEIVADTLWHYLESIEKVPKQKIVDLLPVVEPKKKKNITPFPKKE